MLGIHNKIPTKILETHNGAFDIKIIIVFLIRKILNDIFSIKKILVEFKGKFISIYKIGAWVFFLKYFF